MPTFNVNADNDNFPQLINRVAISGERIVVEQQGKATAAIITYDDLKRLEALENILLKKAELEEYELLRAAIKNSAFDFLKSEEDIYTLADGKPFHDSEYSQSVVSEPDFHSITDPE